MARGALLCWFLAVALAALLLGPDTVWALRRSRASRLQIESDVERRLHGVNVRHGCAVLGSDGSLDYQEGAGCDGNATVARAAFQPGRHTRHGWAQLSVQTLEGHPDMEQLRAAGFLEGYLTAHEIHAHYENVVVPANASAAQDAWLLEQRRWAEEQAGARGPGEPYWRGVGLTLAQLEGLVQGYSQRRLHETRVQRRAPTDLPDLDLVAFLRISAVGDLGDVAKALKVQQGNAGPADPLAAWDGMTPEQALQDIGMAGHCSAIIRVTPDFSNLLLGHSAWFTYAGMVRVYKHLDVALEDEGVALRGMSYSSYPGELASDDDWYLLSTGLAVLQTTNRVLNTSAYAACSPASLPSWLRERAACWSARTAEEWARGVTAHNSGTGNNQWMAVDVGKFVPGTDLPPWFLAVAEAMPGAEVVVDGTPQLARGHWPSYNIPSDPGIYAASGYAAAAAAAAARDAAWGPVAAALSYQRAPRAAIFRRDAGSVDDLAGLRALLRSDAWPHEPLGGGDPLGAICGRADLDPRAPRAYGCYDTKVADLALIRTRTAQGVVGPTTAGGRPAFAWSAAPENVRANTPHRGQPDRFDYRFGLLRPDPATWERDSRGDGAVEGF